MGKGAARGANGDGGVRGKGARMECTALHRVLTPSGRRGSPLLLLLCGDGVNRERGRKKEAHPNGA